MYHLNQIYLKHFLIFINFYGSKELHRLPPLWASGTASLSIPGMGVTLHDYLWLSGPGCVRVYVSIARVHPPTYKYILPLGLVVVSDARCKVIARASHNRLWIGQ